MAVPNVLVLRAPGTNCDFETGFAFERAGATVVRTHVEELLSSPDQLHQQQILCLPGGFSYGDDIASGRVLGNQLREQIAEKLLAFRDAGKLVLGICNGFQVLAKAGLLDVDDDQGPQATLGWNDSGRFEARWVKLAVTPGNCVFLAGQSELELPVAHAEGKFLVRDEHVLKQIESEDRLVLRYVASNGEASRSKAGVVSQAGYPANPNGAIGDIAGICDRSGRVLGLMPHPERFVDPYQHPQWTRRSHREVGEGLFIFQNAVNYFR